MKSYLTEKIFGRELEGDVEPRPKPTPKAPTGMNQPPKHSIEADEIKKVTFKKGDILILRYKQVLCQDALKHLKESCETALDKVGLRGEVAVMVLEQGLDISVLTQEEVKERTDPMTIKEKREGWYGDH